MHKLVNAGRIGEIRGRHATGSVGANRIGEVRCGLGILLHIEGLQRIGHRSLRRRGTGRGRGILRPAGRDHGGGKDESGSPVEHSQHRKTFLYACKQAQQNAV